MTEHERGSTNVHADLGYANADEMLIRAKLANKIAELIQRQRLTQTEAAVIVGLRQPKLSALLHGQFREVSQTEMLNCLARLDLASGYAAMAADQAREAEAAAWTEALLTDVADDPLRDG